MSAFSDLRMAYVCAVENIRFETVGHPSRQYSYETRYFSDLTAYMSTLREPASVFPCYTGVLIWKTSSIGHFILYHSLHQNSLPRGNTLVA